VDGHLARTSIELFLTTVFPDKLSAKLLVLQLNKDPLTLSASNVVAEEFMQLRGKCTLALNHPSGSLLTGEERFE